MNEIPDPMGSPSSITIAVQRCARCGGNHEAMTFVPLDRPAEGWSHFALCPANEQPIMLKLQGGHNPDDKTRLASQLPPPGMRAASMLPDPHRPLIDIVAEAAGWTGQGTLASHVANLRERMGNASLMDIRRVLASEAARLDERHTPHVLDTTIERLDAMMGNDAKGGNASQA